ncbi:14872_t:CDS:2, partial [Gigaspora margarita]
MKLSKKDKNIIDKTNIRGKIKNIIYFSTDSQKKYVIIVNKVARLFPNLVDFYCTKKEANNKANDIKTKQEVGECKYRIETEEDDAENILIIGSVAKPKNFQAQVFEWNGTKYRVVDTVGFGDMNLSSKQVLLKLAEAIHSIKGGIKQVLAVVDGRFTEEGMEAFEILIALFG